MMVLRRLKAEIQSECDDLRRLKDDLDSCRSVDNEMVVLRAKASIFHDFYTGVERIFTRIASELNGGIPHTPHWHSDLLKDMTLELEDIRPRIISGDLYAHLLAYLRFRHLFRNLYGFNLEENRVAELENKFFAVADGFIKEIEAFTRWLDELCR